MLCLVPEARRAFHAGVSFWRGHSELNARSIGIEIVNPGHEWGYRDFPVLQLAAVCDLCLAILSRHPIPARNVVAHSDVAPDRKEDPGKGSTGGAWQRTASACGLKGCRISAPQARYAMPPFAMCVPRSATSATAWHPKAHSIRHSPLCCARSSVIGGPRLSPAKQTPAHANGCRRCGGLSGTCDATLDHFRDYPPTMDCQTAGRRRCPRACPGSGRGKSGLHGNTVPDNVRRGRPQGKRHRNQTACKSRRSGPRARLKWCGKSAPRPWQQGWQGKPHREQDRIGTAPHGAGVFPLRRPGRSREARGKARPRGMVIPIAMEPWARGQNPAYRPSGAISNSLRRLVHRNTTGTSGA